MVQVLSDLAGFIIDLEDEECSRPALHLAAYQGQDEELDRLLNDDAELRDGFLDARIRPFGATPLRLAATGADVLRSS